MSHISVLQCAQEYNELVGKVSNRLESLKAELLELKKQDVSLLRQLIQINDVIQTLGQHTPSPDSAMDESSPTEMFHTRVQKAPLVRQQSVPYYVSILQKESFGSFNSSFEGIGEEPDDDTYSYDDSDSLLSVSLNGNNSTPLYLKPGTLPRSLSYEEHDGRGSDSLVGLDDSFFEGVLQKNIALWKNQTSISQKHIYENVKSGVT